MSSATLVYTVPGMTCGHCVSAVTGEVQKVPGVDAVDIDLDAKLVSVRGTSLDDASIRQAIDDAGFDVA